MMRKIPFWLWHWFTWTLMLTLYGAMLGVLVYLIATPLLFPEISIEESIRKGIQNGGFYFFVWAPGTSIVLCVIEAWGPTLAGSSKSSGQ